MPFKAEYRPNPEPAWVKETIAHPIAQSIRDSGGLPDGQAIEAEVVGMIERYDAQEREGMLTTQPKTPRIRAKDPAADEARKVGARFTRDDAGVRARQERLLVRRTIGKWESALQARLMKLIARMPGVRGRTPAFLYPTYAREFAQQWQAMTRCTGEYEDRTGPERQRIFSRFCEDLADRSIGIMGRWRVGGV